MDFLSIQKVSKRFGETVAVDAVDLEVPRGAFFALLGPSGCGKTTLLRMIGGFEQPDSGTIHIDGTCMNKGGMNGVPAHARPTNMVFQSYAIFPHLNVFDNVAYGLRKEGLSKDELRKRVTDMLATVRLDGMGGRRPDQLSGGQRQRVALARALVKRPKILLLDEPLGALDALTRIEMQRLIEALWREHRFTALLVTHDVAEAVALADRVLLIEDGRIALDECVDLPRPRSRGDVAFARTEARLLERLLGSAAAESGDWPAGCPSTRIAAQPSDGAPDVAHGRAARAPRWPPSLWL